LTWHDGAGRRARRDEQQRRAGERKDCVPHKDVPFNGGQKVPPATPAGSANLTAAQSARKSTTGRITPHVPGGRTGAMVVAALASIALTAAVAASQAPGDAKSNAVTIYRDPHGVPHIEAGSADALAYGTGCEAAK